VVEFPIVDLADGGGATEMDEACRRIGFLAVIGHDVPSDVIEAAWDSAVKFFDLPMEAKMMAASNGPYGYMPFAAEALARSRGGAAPPDLKESFNLHPASPANRDRFVTSVEEALVPASSRHGARLVAGWFAHEEWFSQILHVTEFDDLAALDGYREATQSDAKLIEAQTQLTSLAPERRSELLEPLGPVPVSALHNAIEASREEPVGVYSFAILEVTAGSMERFSSMLSAGASALPIVAAWRDVAGHPNRVIDLWKGDVGKSGYRPTNDQQNAFFEPLREVAPRERMMRLHPMPYSPLR
jgi:hypothetical protein